MDIPDIPEELPLHSRKRGIIVSVGAFLAAIVSVQLVAYAAVESEMISIGWVWLNAVIYILLLLIALLFAYILNQPFSEIFPIRKFEKTMFFGSLFTFLSVWCFSAAVNSINTILFPGMATEHSEGILQLATDTPYIVSIISIAVLPGVFEEVLCRGTMLYALRPLKREWVRILMVGIMFGLLHGIPTQIAYATILGAGFAYIVIKTGNLLYPILWHFVINSFSVTLSILLVRVMDIAQDMADQMPEAAEAADAVATEFSFAFSGIMLGWAVIYTGGGLLLLYGGIRRLNRVALQDVDFKKRRRIQVIAIVLMSLGLVLTLGSCTLMVVEQIA